MLLQNMSLLLNHDRSLQRKKNRIASNRIMRHINKIALHILNKKMVQAGLRHTLEYILI